MTDRPDLAGLEEVEASPWGNTYRSAAFGEAAIGIGKLLILAMTGVGAYHLYPKEPAVFEKPIAAILGLMALGILAWLVKGLSTLFYWRSTPSGLLGRNFFRSQFVEWTSVQSVTMVRGQFEHVFRITANDVKLDVPVSSWPYDLLALSIYQHLRKAGKDETVLMSPYTATFWEEIPERIPDKIEWHNPKPKSWKLGLILLFVAFFASLALYYTNSTPENRARPMQLIMPALLLASMVYRWYLWPALHNARRVALNEDTLTIETARKSITLRWSEGLHAHWLGGDIIISPELALKRCIVIPYYPDSREWAELCLAIIRNLRTANPPQWLPIIDELKKAAGYPPESMTPHI